MSVQSSVQGSVQSYDVKTDVLRVSPEAARHLKAQAEAQGKSGVRVSVKESGCTGYMYVLEEVDSGIGSDLGIPLDNGLQLYIDAESIGFLRGTELNYAQEGVNRVLKFNNPNATAACGCGESFSIG